MIHSIPAPYGLVKQFARSNPINRHRSSKGQDADIRDKVVMDECEAGCRKTLNNAKHALLAVWSHKRES